MLKFYNSTEKQMFIPRFEDETLNAEIVAAREKVENRIAEAIPTADPFAILNKAIHTLRDSDVLVDFIKLYDEETDRAFRRLVYFELEEEPTMNAFIVAFHHPLGGEVVYYSFEEAYI